MAARRECRQFSMRWGMSMDSVVDFINNNTEVSIWIGMGLVTMIIVAALLFSAQVRLYFSISVLIVAAAVGALFYLEKLPPL